MTLRRKKLLLRVVGVAILGAACVVGAQSQLPRTAPSSPVPAADERRPDVGLTSEEETGSLKFDSLCDIRLQRPLFDPPPPPPPKVEVTPPPPLTVKLLGTVIDPANPQAILVDDKQSVSFRSIGQSVSERHPEAIIEEIASDAVTVRRGEETTKLTIQQ